MFPWKQNDEISFRISSDPYQEDFIPEDQIFLGHQASVEGGNIINFVGEGQSQQQHEMILGSSSNITDNDPNFVPDEKKITRKEIERRRRQQMSTLHTSLRSLLPHASLKGKRSTSDQIQEAFNYINYLKNNINELSLERDKLKVLSNSTPLEHGNYMAENIDYTSMTNRVVVGPNLGGVEIIITSCGSHEEGVLLSRVLEEVLEEGLDVVSCFSTRKDDRLYNTIQCQATNQNCIDQTGLQRKLNDLIYHRDHTSGE